MCHTKVVEKIKNTSFVFTNFSPEIRAIYEMTRKNIVEPDRPQFTIWRMRIVSWMPQATNTH
jgi:hypothetical protein